MRGSPEDNNQAQNTAIRPGGYAVTTVHSMPWLSTQIKKKPVKGSRQKQGPTIVNPIFEECAKLTSDPYWSDLLNAAAHGKLPKGFMYKNGVLTYKIGTKKAKKLTLTEDPVLALESCVKFFKDMAGLRSQADKERERTELDESVVEEATNWNEIKRKKLQELLINEFIYSVVQKMNLDKNKKCQLSTMINRGFLMGYFTNDSVQFSDGSIQGINGLLYDQDKGEFIIDNKIINQHKNHRGRLKIVSDDRWLSVDGKCDNDYISFLDLWQKLLTSIEKRDIQRIGPSTKTTSESMSES